MSANATADEFCVGDAVLYTARDGSHKHATIVKVHTDDVVPYFTVSVDGAEKQTERSRLTKPKPKPIYRISKVPKPPPVAPPAPAIDDLGRLQRALAGGAAAAAEPPREPPRRVLARSGRGRGGRARGLQRIRRVWDPSLGVYRSVRLSGEVVEESVSEETAETHGGKGAPRRAGRAADHGWAYVARSFLASTVVWVQVGVCLRG